MIALPEPSVETVPGGVEYSFGASTYDDFITALGADTAFRERLTGWLADVPFEAFKWETPSVDARSTSQRFRFVVLDSPALARSAPNPSAFSRQLDAARRSGDTVADFTNLGGDAHLVAPCPSDAAPGGYAHLGVFVRSAPIAEQHAFWRRVASVTRSTLARRRTWLSTAGLGVPWLHVRLDTRPKYYGYGPYRRI